MPGILAAAIYEAPDYLRGFLVYRTDPFEPVIATFRLQEVVVPPVWIWRDGAFQPCAGILEHHGLRGAICVGPDAILVAKARPALDWHRLRPIAFAAEDGRPGQ